MENYIPVSLLVLIFIVPSLQITPLYSYDCKENGDIVVHGLSKNSTIHIETVNNVTVEGSDCHNITNMSGDLATIPSSCTNTSKENRTVIIKVVDPFIDKPFTTAAPTTTTTAAPTHTTAAPTPTTTHKRRRKRSVFNQYGQQQHYYSLVCQQLNSDGVIQKVLHQVGIQKIVPLQTVHNSVENVEMRFKAEERTTEGMMDQIPDISSLYLGDKFYMYLRYMGKQNYKIYPQNCTAYDGGWAVVNKQVEHVSLWTYENCTSDDSNTYHLMHNFKKISDQIVYAEMFAFHFATYKDITIECDVRICSKKDRKSQCYLKIVTSGKDECEKDYWTSRRRRSTGNHKNVKVAGTLQIIDKKPTDTNAAGMLRNGWLYFLAFQIILQYA